MHTAPGHGQEDYQTGLKYGLELLSPVDDAGRFTAEAGEDLKGMSVLGDGNAAVIDKVNATGALLLEESYEHKYPYDWRTKKPTIFRATDQWFASVDAFKGDALEAIDGVEWVPSGGKNRITAFTSGRSEWCISRQRTWGVPIPVFYDKESGEPLLTEETIAHVQEVFMAEGSDAWFTRDVEDLLPEGLRGDASKYRKGTDTMDVWFDSGTSWAGVAKARDTLSWPADLYLEGSDQHRGWFQSSLLTSVASNGKAPYKAVLTHGFVMDEKGRKMSKSLGNVVLPSQVIEGGNDKKKQPAYGADVLRLWVASVDYTGDVAIGDGIVKQTFDGYRKLRNTFRYLIGNLHDFDPEADAVPIEDLPALDRHILQRLSEVVADADAAYAAFQFQRVAQSVAQFVTADLSNFYLESAKDRLYISAKGDSRRRSCQTTMRILLEALAKVLAPVLPHLAEDVWLNLPYATAQDSVLQAGWPALPEACADPGPLSRGAWDLLRSLRDDANQALEAARQAKEIGAGLDALVYVVPPEGSEEAAEELLAHCGAADSMVDELKYLLTVSQVELLPAGASTEALKEKCGTDFVTPAAEGDSPFAVGVAKAKGTKCNRCWHYSETVGDSDKFPTACDRCVDVLEKDGHDV